MLLSKQDLITRNPSCRYLAAHCLIKQSRFDEALGMLGERNPTHLIHANAAAKRKTHARRPKASTSSSAKPPGRGGGGDAAGGEDEEEASNRRYEAAMCYLRGICFAKQNAFDRAKECYKDAVRIDVQCFEAFNQLMKNSLMSPEEEETFLESLDFASVKAPVSTTSSSSGLPPDTATTASTGTTAAADDEADADEPADYVHMLYQTRLSKYRNPRAFNTAVETLSTHYGLADNADLLLARADLLYTQCRFRDALAVTSAVLDRDRYNFAVYPLHLACLSELKMTNTLFLVAHDLADGHPDEPCAWLAVATYYFATGKIADARRYFSKASMMDAHFGPAWIGFAHTFAAEGEHDQAVSAYSTAARLFMGTHLPQVFLGMQSHAMNNMTAAEEFLKTAYALCPRDPLLLNEMGVVLYHQDRLQDAAAAFAAALRVAADIDSDPAAWLSARTNLAHTYRRLRLHARALDEFDRVLREGGKDGAVFAAKGLVYLDQGRPDEAVRVLHEALAIHPQDPIATELLNKALEETVGTDPIGGQDEGEGGEGGEMDAFERELGMRKAEAGEKMAARLGRADKGKGKGKGRGGGGGSAKGKGKGRATRSDALGSGEQSLMDEDEVR